jgi:hypothetical protein
MCKQWCFLFGLLLILSGLTLTSSRNTFCAGTEFERTELISVSTTGVQGDLGSGSGDSTPDGRYVVFASHATNLVENDSNGKSDIFLHDRDTGETIRVSVASDGSQADGDSKNPSISDDGRYIAFQSGAENLISNDINRAWSDIYLRDIISETTTLISIDSDENQKWGAASDPHISGDGNHVAFEFWSEFDEELDPTDNNNNQDIYVRDLVSGTTTLVSIATNGTQGNAISQNPKLSTTGRYVAFASTANTFATGDALNTWDVFVHDQATGTTTIASVSSAGVIGNGISSNIDISGDGRYIVFNSSATNLVANASGLLVKGYLHDLITGETIWIGEVGVSVISANGRYIVTGEEIANLFEKTRFRIYDRESGASWPVNPSNLREVENESSTCYAISDDGRALLFISTSDNLISNDQNGTISDIFVTDPKWYLDLPNQIYLPWIGR